MFASETCAFDLIGAEYERDVKPGELVIVGPEGVTFAVLLAGAGRSRAAFSSTCIFRVPTAGVWALGAGEPEDGAAAGAGSSGRADVVVPVPDSGVTAAVGYAAESGHPFRFGLIRNHYVGRTFIEPSRRCGFRRALKLNPVRSLLEGKRVVLIDDSIVRGTTSQKDCAHGPQCGREGSAHADFVSADDFAVLLRSGYAFQETTDRGQ